MGSTSKLIGIGTGIAIIIVGAVMYFFVHGSATLGLRVCFTGIVTILAVIAINNNS
jgi:hypothetical protein